MKEETDNRLDGWSTQLPLYDIYKKLDITDYTSVDREEVKNFFSERATKKGKQK